MTHWHHAPPHRLKAVGAYMITGATIHKKYYFYHPEHLNLLQSLLFELIESYGLGLKAWAIFSNHYHLILLTYPESGDPHQFIRHLHSSSARKLNKIEQRPGRRIWLQFWDTQLTYRNSYYARMNYVINNPVHHGLVDDAKLYQWCSARWFARNAEPGHYRTVMSFRSDKVNVIDTF
ncbi:Uncharacterized protein SCG7086_AM_00050 [Chlamydiales bacterium SCGC AG-110-P3]|nr:Uncharacterized protein SCG7086_AM_00050 [Chlamydiales bacterium SCGC AG-110-P3]